MARKQYREWNPRQSFILPPSPSEWLPDDHLAYFILDVIEELDLTEIDRALQAKDARGERPYPPRMMVALLLLGYCVGIYSSRKLELATYESVAFRVLCGDCHPFFTRIAEFRRTHLKTLEGLFVQVLRMCQGVGLVKLGLVALDGTKMQANASKHKAMSYERMIEQEQKLSDQVADLLGRAEQADQEEDRTYGVGKAQRDLPDELKRREDRLRKIREAKLELEREAAAARARLLAEQAEQAARKAEAAERAAERDKQASRASELRAQADKLERQVEATSNGTPPITPNPAGLPEHRVPTTEDGKPKPKAQRNFTDPDSRIMTRNGEYLQGYNCQAAVDGCAQVIVAWGVSNMAPDTDHFPAMVDHVVDNCGAPPEQAVADAGYWKPGHEAHGQALGIDVFISLKRERHGESPSPPEDPPPPTEEQPLGRMRAKLQTEVGKRVRARRKAVVEPVFGQIKGARGFRQFLLRGLPKVNSEWCLLCTVHNLLKLFRFRAQLVQSAT